MQRSIYDGCSGLLFGRLFFDIELGRIGTSGQQQILLLDHEQSLNLNPDLTSYAPIIRQLD